MHVLDRERVNKSVRTVKDRQISGCCDSRHALQ